MLLLSLPERKTDPLLPVCICSTMNNTTPDCEQQTSAKNVTFSLEEENEQHLLLESKKVKSENIHLKVSPKNVLCSLPSPCTVPTSRTIILVRGSSYSLVEFPTFLPANYTVSTRPTRYSCNCVPTVNTEISLAQVLADYKPKKKLLQASSQCS